MNPLHRLKQKCENKSQFGRDRETVRIFKFFSNGPVAFIGQVCGFYDLQRSEVNDTLHKKSTPILNP